MRSLRLKTHLVVLPIIVAAVASSGYLTFLESRSALTRLANRHLAYKAEQLRDYVNNEWDIVESLGLSGRKEYRDAQEASFRSYAYSLLRSDTELILAVDGSGELRQRIGSAPMLPAEPGEALIDLPLGWFSAEILGEERIGIAFDFEPFGWRIGISELGSLYFSDVEGILRKNIAILAAALAVSALLTAFYLRYVTGPLERLNAAVARVTATHDLALRVPIESRDEIGALARGFNEMIGSLESQNRMLSDAHRAERDARETAVSHEKETLFLLGKVSDYNDEKTGTHLKRIGAQSALFARLLGLGEAREELMQNSAPLHDIGKIGVPQAILQKPDRLTDEEQEIMKTHAQLGYELLKGSTSRFLSEASVIAYTHHEHWDGSGYPRGVAGEAIPLSGRIVSIVDVFDALVSDRPYKKAWSMEDALAFIAGQGGRKFDPSLVGIFTAHFAVFALVWEDLRDTPTSPIIETGGASA